MKRIGLFLISMLFSSTAMAASGTINIQTVPAGAYYFLVSSQNMELVKEGLSPYFDLNVPTDKYKMCFQLDGYVTEWQDATVQTFGSAWVGPVLKKPHDVLQTRCADAISRMKAESAQKTFPGRSGHRPVLPDLQIMTVTPLEMCMVKSSDAIAPEMNLWGRRVSPAAGLAMLSIT